MILFMLLKKAIKESALADYLAAQPVADYRSMRVDFPDENIFLVEEDVIDHETWIMLFNGASMSWKMRLELY